jgi:hypothetical protein
MLNCSNGTIYLGVIVTGLLGPTPDILSNGGFGSSFLFQQNIQDASVRPVAPIVLDGNVTLVLFRLFFPLLVLFLLLLLLLSKIVKVLSNVS